MWFGLKAHVEVRFMKTIVQNIGGRNWEYALLSLGFYTKHKAILFAAVHYKP